MIAGQNILYLPGTVVQPGGYMHGYITTNNQYCGQQPPAIPAIISGENQLPVNTDLTYFTLYPNPTSGNFTVEEKGEAEYDNVKIEVFSMTGDRLMSTELHGQRKHEFMTNGLPGGLYFIKVIANEHVETFKLVKTR